MNVGLNGERLPIRDFKLGTPDGGNPVDSASDLFRWGWDLSVLCTHQCTPSTQWNDWHSVKICWMNECLVCWDNSVASGFGGTDSFGIPGRLGLSSLQISSLSALRFLLLLWGIVCVLLPVHQTQFNELFLFSCLPARSHFLFLKMFMLQAHWLGNFTCESEFTDESTPTLSLWPPTDVVHAP